MCTMRLKSMVCSHLPSIFETSPCGQLVDATIVVPLRRLTSVAAGLWQIAQTCGSSVRLLPCRLSDLWQALQRAMSTTTRRFSATVPVAAATLNTFFTGMRSVNAPLPSMSPAGWPSNPSMTVPVTVAGIATAEVIV